MTTTTALPIGATGTNPIKALNDFGQSPWMDYIRRDLLLGGGLKKMIDQDGLRGQTSNPTIFEKAITGGTYYSDITDSPDAKKLDAKGIYEKIAIRDVQDATDIFKGVYADTKRRDGYVSLEVSPLLANNTQGTIEEARRLWKSVNRPNVMIKVPGHARRHSRDSSASRGRHQHQRHAALRAVGLRTGRRSLHCGSRSPRQERRRHQPHRQRRQLLRQPHRHADRRQYRSQAEDRNRRRAERHCCKSIEGKVAIANAKLTYKKYQELFGGARWKALAAKGAQTQRLLWASTSTKNPEVSRRALRRRTDRRRHRRHHSAGHLRRLPRSRQAPQEPDGKRGCRRQNHVRPRKGRHLDEASHRQACRRRREALRRSVRQIARSHRENRRSAAREPKSPDLQTPRRALWRRPVVDQRLEDQQTKCRASGSTTLPSGPTTTKQVARLARHRR